MQTLLSVPPALVADFHDLSGVSGDACFVSCDPAGSKLGSGGGTANLLFDAWKAGGGTESLESWADADRRLILHAGGQSRRLPAYAPSSKALIPIPVFRWMSGQRIDQTLLDLQTGLLKSLLDSSPAGLKWLIASGDALIWNDAPLPAIPDVDVLCVGLSESPERASRHGVFFAPRNDPGRLAYMLQKPSPADIAARATESLYFIDSGIWLLSTRAILALLERCGWRGGDAGFAGGFPANYDLYSDFGPALGESPTNPDPGIPGLKAAILPLPEAEFYHFGSNRDIIHSSLALQNRVHDPKRILSPLIKPHPRIFVQSSVSDYRLREDNQDVWIENCRLGEGWNLAQRHILTGIPETPWGLNLPEGVCLDIVPVGEGDWVLRLYGFDDAFRGSLNDPGTTWMERPFPDWCAARGMRPEDVTSKPETDIQQAPLFPVTSDVDGAGELLDWMIGPAPSEDAELRESWLQSRRLSAEEISDTANLNRLFAQRRSLLKCGLSFLASHADRSVFHQIDLDQAARLFAETDHPLPPAAPDPKTRLFPFIRDRMFRRSVEHLRGDGGEAFEREAFGALRESIVAPYRGQIIQPRNQALSDQVIWSRSPVRLDLAGGWTDTPPYCFLNGGRVVNLAVELNGQPPIQVFLRVSPEPRIVLRSIDLGVTETLTSYDDIARYSEIGSGFSIPRAALALAGFHPDFQAQSAHADLRTQLEDFGGGIEISLLCAVPKGSGLGTSSILAATVLGGLSDLCGLGWDKKDIANRTLALEQMLTSGGGWQDQYGGILHGIKRLETGTGLDQVPDVRWLPDHLFTDPAHTQNILLYYTGITRVAKNLLGEIVRGMFLNRNDCLSVLNRLYHHADEAHTVIQRGSFAGMARAVRRTWELNQELDSGTNPPEVREIVRSIDDWLLGMKLLGAGGGGYFLLLAKDPDAAARIRNQLESNPPNPRARFVRVNVSNTGLQITRS